MVMLASLLSESDLSDHLPPRAFRSPRHGIEMARISLRISLEYPRVITYVYVPIKNGLNLVHATSQNSVRSFEDVNKIGRSGHWRYHTTDDHTLAEENIKYPYPAYSGEQGLVAIVTKHR